MTPQIRRARQQAVDDATAAVAEAVRARTDAAASAVHVADLDIALAELQRELARTRMWQPALAELTPTTPARHTPYPARIAVPILPAPTDPTTTDPTTSAPGASEPTVPTAPTGDTDAAAHPSAGRAAPEPSAAGSSAPQEAMPHATADAPVAPDLAVATEGTAASDPTVSAAATDDPALTPDPEAARVLAATTEVERLTSDVRAATAAELAARLAAEEEARQAEEAAAADAARRAAQAASLGAYQNGQIPGHALCAPDFATGHRLRCDAAEP